MPLPFDFLLVCADFADDQGDVIVWQRHKGLVGAGVLKS
jgi:hypothetical protein